ncbi:hypothetical protein ACIBO5_44655 [Nonomuraea angiospora]|uniref:hypothetical protein n=1 Tax=Nonomuraea angiospora TaxID=46172 RepID=UPI0037B11F1F
MARTSSTRTTAGVFRPATSSTRSASARETATPARAGAVGPTPARTGRPKARVAALTNSPARAHARDPVPATRA